MGLAKLLEVKDPLASPAPKEHIEATKTAASESFHGGDMQAAITGFSTAILAVEEEMGSVSVDADNNKNSSSSSMLKNFAAGLYSNRSLVLLRVLDEKLYDDSRIRPILYEQIKRDCGSALRLQPSSFKAYYRRAMACYELGEFAQAWADVERVVKHYMQLDKQNPDAMKLREKIQVAMKAERQKWNGIGVDEANRSTTTQFNQSQSRSRWNKGTGAGATTTTTTDTNANTEPDYIHDGPLGGSQSLEMAEPAPKKWTRAILEKRLTNTTITNKQNPSIFFSTFCSPEEIIQMHEDDSFGAELSTEAFSGLLKLLERWGEKERANSYLNAGKKVISELGLLMLSETEQAVLNRVEARFG